MDTMSCSKWRVKGWDSYWLGRSERKDVLGCSFFPTQKDCSRVWLFQHTQAVVIGILLFFSFCYSSLANVLAWQKESSFELAQQRNVSNLVQLGLAHPWCFMWTRNLSQHIGNGWRWDFRRWDFLALLARGLVGTSCLTIDCDIQFCKTRSLFLT